MSPAFTILIVVYADVAILDFSCDCGNKKDWQLRVLRNTSNLWLYFGYIRLNGDLNYQLYTMFIQAPRQDTLINKAQFKNKAIQTFFNCIFCAVCSATASFNGNLQ